MFRFLKLIVIFTMFAGAGLGQIDMVATDGIETDFHRRNVGRIVFLEKPQPADRVTETDVLKSVRLRDTANLDIRVFMDDSLTNHLRRIAPEMSAADLVRKGNFQFSFFVDDALVYRENLSPGAGTPETKNRRTTFRVPLISSAGEDSWGRFLWMRFMLRGGEEALFDASRRLRIEIRPYVNADEIRVGNLIATGELLIDAVAPEVDEKDLAIQRPKSAKGWRVAKPKFDRALIRELNRRIALGLYKDITGIVVVRKGQLALEQYFNGATRETLHDTRSVGKSFLSALVGIAVGDGFLKSEKQTLREFYDLSKFENNSREKADVTIEQLLTMTSGFAADDSDEESPGNEEKMYPTTNWVKFALDLPMESNPATRHKWRYFTGGSIILGDILERKVPGGLEKYAAQKLFRPLGIENYEWQYTPQKVPNTAGGLRLRALDLARFGELCRSGGNLAGKQILPRPWIEKSLARQVTLPDQQSYGYLFWKWQFLVADKTFEASFASGNGGNRIVILKDAGLVIVITATAYNMPYGHPQSDRIIEKFLLRAFMR